MSPNLHPFRLAAILALLATTTSLQANQPQASVDFDREVRPILSDKCYACHGPDEATRQAGLRLDTREGAFAVRGVAASTDSTNTSVRHNPDTRGEALAEGGGYQVIVPGDAAASRLYQRISHEQEVARMPPAAFERKLAPDEIDTIRRWIDQGAGWETHWAYLPPRRPEPPTVGNVAWARNAIDNFVLARLEKEGLEPSPEADKITLLRRVSFDLTGLPPSPEQVDAFLADDSPDAYEKRVDELLKSAHYGERMAMQWLDLARYADTHGYHIDSHRDMWRWRDWVIQAFNHNMPYDRFTIEQLAGDLLPDPTREQLIATGFNRNHMINFEGGAIPEEYLNEYVIDRLDTTATVWMGMTMGCARCHDHKYDPITQRDFYRFYAFFNGVPEKGLDGTRGNAAPMLQITTRPEERQLETLERKIEKTERKLPKPEIDRFESAWLPTALEQIPTAPTDGLTAHFAFEDDLAGLTKAREVDVVRGEVTYNDGQVGRAARFSGQTHVNFGHEYLLGDDPFAVALWMRGSRTSEKVILHKTAKDESRTGFEISLGESEKTGNLERGQTLYVKLVHKWPDDAIWLKSEEPLTLGSWYQISVTYDGSGKSDGVKVYLNGKPAEMKGFSTSILINGKPTEMSFSRDSLSGSIANNQPIGVGDESIGEPFKGDMDDLRIYERVLRPDEVEQLAIHQPARALLAHRQPGGACTQYGDLLSEDEEANDDADGEKKKRSKEERNCRGQAQTIRRYFVTHHAPKRYRNIYADLQELKEEQSDLEERIPTIMVMRTMDEPRDTYILGRGDYRNKGEKVAPSTPAVLPPLPPGAPVGRLGLAKWLVSPDHPLTARVAVNRYWQAYFGAGIVKTSEDFGSQGEAPSHPELLDWLAVEFVESGWDVKALQRLIVTSAAYRQTSRAARELQAEDPENRLLARGPRFRLPAEVVRDNALAVSGLLVPKIGGPSVYPYQPPGLWKEMSFGDRFSAQEYSVGKGDQLYRRSLYTFWKRTVPPPTLATFDAPDREKCTVRRPRTNTPLQALILMNDPTYVEAARALAERALTEGGDTDSGRLAFTYRRATAREPSAKEKDVLLTLLHQQVEDYRRNPAEATELLSVGDSPYNASLDEQQLAAWTMVASTILNLDETITKE